MKMVSVTDDVFKRGNYGATHLNKRIAISYYHQPQKSIDTLVFSPTKSGTYSVLLFLHGFEIPNTFYKQLLEHITSHGYIIVAPQLYTELDIDVAFFHPNIEVERAAGVTNWISSGSLESVCLPAGVEADVEKLVLAGHSRGGKQAFALALGKAKTQTTLKPSVLVGLDPVAGVKVRGIPIVETEPNILTYSPESFELDIPVVVIGTGIGGPCSPEKWNHDEFFSESKPARAHIVAKEYGHLDMLDVFVEKIGRLVCEHAAKDKDRDRLRRCFGGIFVAVAKAFLEGEADDFNAIVVNHTVTPPVILDPNCFDNGKNIKARL